MHLARDHAFQLISLEQTLHIFHELSFQRAFLQHPNAMVFINAVYSYVHIPATILFLIALYYITITSTNTAASQHPSTALGDHPTQSLTGSALYQARRRTLATANLIAFIVFTTWPLMPPRLLSDTAVTGPSGDKARAFGFQDTVHRTGKDGGSIWTTNKFCNQWAAMPSLHFGYALLIGLTIMGLPLKTKGRGLLSWRRTFCVGFGLGYPLVILVAVIATANHFFLDVVGGAIVIALAWSGERVLLNLLPLEDWALSFLRIHKPEGQTGSAVIKLERD